MLFVKLISLSIIGLCSLLLAYQNAAAQESGRETVPIATDSMHQSRILSAEHVNLVRVSGEMISDVVFDTEALEVEPDRERGIVFIRVRPQWLLKAEQSGKSETAAFFNTKETSYGLTFRVARVASQTIEITPSVLKDKTRSGRTTESALIELSDTGIVLGNSAYVETVKTLIKRALREQTQTQGAIGELTVQSKSDFEALHFASRVQSLKGMRCRESRAYHAPGYLIEVIEVTNLSGKKTAVPLSSLSEMHPTTVAVASFSRTLAPGAMTTVVLVRRVREGEAVTLTVNALEEN